MNNSPKYIEHLNDIGLATSRPKPPREGDVYIDVHTNTTYVYTNRWVELELASTTIKYFEDTKITWLQQQKETQPVPRFEQVADEL